MFSPGTHKSKTSIYNKITFKNKKDIEILNNINSNEADCTENTLKL